MLVAPTLRVYTLRYLAIAEFLLAEGLNAKKGAETTLSMYSKTKIEMLKLTKNTN
jgi:hypothetical protein